MAKCMKMMLLLTTACSLAVIGCGNDDDNSDGAANEATAVIAARIEGVVESVGSDGAQLAGVVQGVYVELVDSSGDTIAATDTDQAGRFIFEQIESGNYTIRFKAGGVTGETEISVEAGDETVMTVTMSAYGDVTASITKVRQDGKEETVDIKPKTMTVYYCKNGQRKSRVVTVAEFEAHPDKWRIKNKACTASLPPSLILYYSFDKNDGKTVADESGNGNVGNVHGPQWVANGKYGAAYRFDGEDDYIRTSRDNPLPTGTEDFTVTVWARPDVLSDTKKAHEGDTRVLFANQFAVNDFQLAVQVPGWIGMWTGVPQSAGNYTPTVSWTLGNWYHFAATRESGVIKIYRDGQLLHSASDVGSDSIQGSLLDIGFRTSTGSHPWEGMIDEFRIYDRGLSGDEVRSIYKGVAIPK